MAIPKMKGFCPVSELQRRAIRAGNLVAIKALGSRAFFMVYPYGFIPEEEALIFPLMDTPIISRRVGAILRELIPDCIYPEIGKVIEIRDCESFEGVIWNTILVSGDGFHVGFMEEDDRIVMRIARA